MARVNKRIIKDVAIKTVGLVAGGRAAKMATSLIPVENTYIKNGIPLALGAFLMTQKTPFVQALGAGMVTRAGDQMLDAAGIGSPLLGDTNGMNYTFVPSDNPLAGDDSGNYDTDYDNNY